jgi:hypothetical protein
MRLKLLLVSLGIVFVLATGFTLGGLPFNPGARYSDAVTSHWTAALFLRKSVLDQHTFPLWRETTMAGAPFAANPLNKTAYPLQWLALLFPPALHLDIVIVLHLLIAGAGMWRWTRGLGLRPEAAGLSALAYTLGPRLIGHTGAGHLDLLYAAAWLPWLMASVKPSPPPPLPQGEGREKLSTTEAYPLRQAVPLHSAVQQPDHTMAVGAGLRPAPTQNRMNYAYAIALLRQVIQVALFAGLLFLADTRLSLFGFSLAGVYAVYEAARIRRLNWLVWMVPALVIFLLLTASVTAPLIGWSPYLSRAGLTAQEAGIFSLEPAQFIGLVLPPQAGNIEMLTYVGWPVLALAGVALLAMPRKLLFWLGVLVVAGWYALGENGLLWSLLVKIAPLLLWFRVPSRAWFVLALVLPLLAGYGLDWLIGHLGRRAPPRWRLAALAGLAAALTCGVIALVALPLPDGAGWSILVGGGGLAFILFLLFNSRLTVERAALLLVLVTFADLLITGRSWLEWRGEDDWLTPYAPLAAVLVEDEADRVYSPTYSLPQQVAEAYDLRLFGGVDPFQIEGVTRAVAQAGGVEWSGYSVVAPPLNGIEGDDPATANRDAMPKTGLLARWNVSRVVSAYPIENARLRLVDEVGGISVYRNLDYAAQANTTASFPLWPTGWAGLPEPATVEQLNQLTFAAAVVGVISLITCILLLLRIKR